MNVKFLGQACTLIEIKEKRILCDPWIVGPCNVNSWYHLNRRIHTKKDIPTDIDYIYISHEHTDHFQTETLKEFEDADLSDEDTRIKIAKKFVDD